MLEQGDRCAAWSSIDVWSERQVKEVILTQTGLRVEYIGVNNFGVLIELEARSGYGC